MAKMAKVADENEFDGTAATGQSEDGEASDGSGEFAEPDLTDDEHGWEAEDLYCESAKGAVDANGRVKQSGERVTQKARSRRSNYVETSLDDLSYSSTGSASEGAEPTVTGCRLSADEEVERRLLDQMQNEQRQKQLRQHQHQQVIQVQAPPNQACRAPAAAQINARFEPQRGDELEDEKPPEVPVRRSSKAGARMQQPAGGQVQTSRHQSRSGQFDLSQLPRPLLGNEPEQKWRNQQQQNRAQRPARPRMRPLQPPPPPPSRPRAQAPRNIWSPSTSSAVSASQSSSCDSLNLVAKVAPPASNSSLASNCAPSRATLAEELSTPSPLSTVVERRLTAADSMPAPQALHSSGKPGDEERTTLAHEFTDAAEPSRHEPAPSELATKATCAREMVGESIAVGSGAFAAAEKQAVCDTARRPSESGAAAPPKEQSAGDGYAWHSISVSLEQQERLKQLKRQQQQQQQQELVSRPNLRSFSIATATLRPNQQVGHAGGPSNMDSDRAETQLKYWTLPSSSNLPEAEGAASGSLGRQAAAAQREKSGRASDGRSSNNNNKNSNSCGPDEELGNDQTSLGGSERQRSADYTKIKNGQEISYELETKSYRYKERTFYEMSSESNEAKQQHQESQPEAQAQHRYDSDRNQSAGGYKHEWFKQMYKQMHNKQTPEKNLLQTVNSQPDTTQITVKLKSPKSDHRFSPSYYSEEDFERRRDKNSVSPTFKPGHISDYVPGESSISQHERNLELYYNIIAHIDRVFSSVLPEVTSRSTNTLQAIKQQSLRRRKKKQEQSKSGPQTPISTLTKRRATDLASTGHESKCVFNQLLQSEPALELNANAPHGFGSQQDLTDSDSHKVYVAVQQGRDIPLKGLRKPAPEPNFYKVGFTPPVRQLDSGWLGAPSANRDRLSQPNLCLQSRQPTTEVCDKLLNDLWQDDAFRDFDSVYRSMIDGRCAERNDPVLSERQSSCLDAGLQLSPSADSTYGKLLASSPTVLCGLQTSPSASVAASSEQTRADSRNTNLSFQNGPALVEEMTLSDLEEEISSSLYAAKEANARASYLSTSDRQLVKGRRSRQPLPLSLLERARPSQQQQNSATSGYHSDYSRPNEDHMFSDDSINIHYKSPTSKLLKMNTFNEFELNRIKRLYTEELSNRLQRSRSTRLPSDLQHQTTKQSATNRLSEHQRRQTKSSERLAAAPGRNFRMRDYEAPSSPAGGCTGAVDLNRYQRAFLAKPALALGSATARLQGAQLGRALFDFQAKNERELSLRRGDLVELLELHEHSWAKVEDCQSGLQGFVPLNYIDYSVGCAVAKRDVSGQIERPVRTSACEEQVGAPLLPMHKGEPITLLRRLSGHWYEASNTRQAMGLVWSNDLDIIKQPVLGQPVRPPHATRPSASDEISTDEEIQAFEEPRRQRRRQFQDSELMQGKRPDAEGEARHDDEEGDEEEEIYITDTGERVLARRRARSTSGTQDRRCGTRAKASSNYGRAKQRMSRSGTNYAPSGCGENLRKSERYCCHAKDSEGRQQPRRSSSSPYISGSCDQQSRAKATDEENCELPRLCRAKFAYKPRQKDELELVVGDILMVVHECDDGWFIGSSYSSKQMGTFPGNFVEPI